MANVDRKPHDNRRRLQTPFYSRAAAACETNEWGEWKGYTRPGSYTNVEYEYFAVRNGTGVFDLTPMIKYRIEGPDADAYLDRLMTRDVAKIPIGRVGYCMWCNDSGQVLDDGTLFHLGENRYRLCSQERCLEWLHASAMGFEVRIADETADIAALAIQGPTSCAVLKNMGLAGVGELRYFDLRAFDLDGEEVLISRTGYTGDLGYEAWMSPGLAETFWDRLFAAGRNLSIRPMGACALEIARIEAGFIQAAVDFVPADQMVRPGRGRSPFELGCGWLVDFDKPHFNGRKALLAERRNGSRFNFARLDVEGNKPAEHAFIYNRRKKVVGTVTSAAWCPTAKRNIALASLTAPWGQPGDELYAEIYYQRELQWNRVMARCEVVTGPVFDPERRRLTPPADY